MIFTSLHVETIAGRHIQLVVIVVIERNRDFMSCAGKLQLGKALASCRHKTHSGDHSLR